MMMFGDHVVEKYTNFRGTLYSDGRLSPMIDEDDAVLLIASPLLGQVQIPRSSLSVFRNAVGDSRSGHHSRTTRDTALHVVPSDFGRVGTPVETGIACIAHTCSGGSVTATTTSSPSRTRTPLCTHFLDQQTEPAGVYTTWVSLMNRAGCAARHHTDVHVAMARTCSRTKASKQANNNGIVFATASILTGLFGHRVTSWRLQTTDL